MLAEIETRKVSLAKWWNPWSWGKHRIEWRYVWDTNTVLEAVELLGEKSMANYLKSEWKQSAPPVQLILNRNTLNETSFYVNKEDLCQQ